MPIQNNNLPSSDIAQNYAQGATAPSNTDTKPSANDSNRFDWVLYRAIRDSGAIPRLFFDIQSCHRQSHPYPMTYISEAGLTPIEPFGSKKGLSGILFSAEQEKYLLLGAARNMFSNSTYWDNAVFKGNEPNVHEIYRHNAKTMHSEKRRTGLYHTQHGPKRLPLAYTEFRHIKQKLEEIEYRRSGKIPDVSSKYQLVALLKSLCQQADQNTTDARGWFTEQFDMLEAIVLSTPEGNQNNDIYNRFNKLIKSIKRSLPEAHVRLRELAPALEKVEDPRHLPTYLKKAMSTVPSPKYKGIEEIEHNEQIIYPSTQYISGIRVDLSLHGVNSAKQIHEQLSKIGKISDLQKLLYWYTPKHGVIMMGDINSLTQYETIINQSRNIRAIKTLKRLIVLSRSIQTTTGLGQQDVFTALFRLIKDLKLSNTQKDDLIDQLYLSSYKVPRPTKQELENNLTCTEFLNQRLSQAKQDDAYVPFNELKVSLSANADSSLMQHA